MLRYLRAISSIGLRLRAAELALVDITKHGRFIRVTNINWQGTMVLNGAQYILGSMFSWRLVHQSRHRLTGLFIASETMIQHSITARRSSCNTESATKIQNLYFIRCTAI